MVEVVEWNGRRYRRYPESARRSDSVYFYRMGKGRTFTLHRDVWEFHNGPIPDGAHIHHRDGNPLNNDIGNLDCLSAKQHRDEHPWDEDRKRRQSALLERIRPLTKEWHASAEGRAKHRELGGLAYQRFVPVAKDCAHCSTRFEPSKIGNLDRFCSNKCKSAWRRASGVDNEQRQCAHCGASFECNRYSGTKACSRSCGNSLRGATLRACV